MRLILPLAEQLDRAVTELSIGRPLNDRLAFILIDNALELMCHQRCVELIEEDGRAVTPRLQFKDKAAGRGRMFDAKIALLKRQGVFAEIDARAIQVLHSHRNQLYHVGLRDDPVIGPFARLYLQLTLRHAPKLLRPVRYLQWEATLAGDEIIGFFPELAAARRYSSKVDIVAFGQRLAGRVGDDPMPFKEAVADHVFALVNKAEANFSIIAKGRSGMDEPEDTLRRVQLEADTIAEVVRRHRVRERMLKAGQVAIEPFDPDRLAIARGTDILVEANRKYLPSWKPRHETLPFAAWRRQASRLRQAADNLTALDRFARIRREIDEFEDIMAEPIQDMHGWNQYLEDAAMDRR